MVAGNKVTEVLVTLADTVAEGDVVSYTINNGTAVEHSVTTAEAAAHAFTILDVQIPADGDTLTVNAAVIKDAVGNSVATPTTATDTAIVDLTAPNNQPVVDANTTTPTPDVLYTLDSSPVITGTVSQALAIGEVLQVTIGGATYELVPDATTLVWTLDTGTTNPITGSPTFTPLTSGNNSVVAKVIDQAGNSITDTTNDEVVVLAQVTNITVIDDLTDLVGGLELSGSTTPTGSATNIDGIEGKYEGIVSQAVGTALLEGLTNDNTPDISVTLDKNLATDFQQLDIVRSYQRADGEWVLDDNVSNGGVVNGIVASTTSGLIPDIANGTIYSFTDNLPDGGIDKNYRYEAKITNDTVISDPTLVTSQVTEFELDTVAQTPVMSYKNGVLSGNATDDGVIYVNFAGDYVEVQVEEGVDWELPLKSGQATAFELINDPDNYDTNSNSQPSNISAELDSQDNPKVDGFLPIGFVDKAGNVPYENIEFYHFNSSDGPDGEFNPEDNPATAINAFTDANGVTSLSGITTDGSTNVYTTTFSDDAQIVYVESDISTYSGDTRFEVDFAGGNDILTLKGNINSGVIIDMGSGDDSVVTDRLAGTSSRYSEVKLGEGNNTFTANSTSNFQYIEVTGGDGDDIFFTQVGSDIGYSNIYLGGGDNVIKSGSDFDNVRVITTDGDDFVEIAADGGGTDISGSYIDLGDGNNTINILEGGVNRYRGDQSQIFTGNGDDTVYMTDNFEDDSTLTLRAGNDTVTIEGNVINTAIIDTGADDDTVTIDGNVINNAIIDTGADDDIVTIDGNIEIFANVILGAGNDTFTSTGFIDGTVNTGLSDDIINIDGNVRSASTIDAGEGIDTLNVTNDGSNANISLNNVLNVEVIDLGNSGRDITNVNVSYLEASGNDLFIRGGADSRVNIGNQAGNTLIENNSNGNAAWTITGTDTMTTDAVTYDIYTNANSINAVYIEQGISVI